MTDHNSDDLRAVAAELRTVSGWHRADFAGLLLIRAERLGAFDDRPAVAEACRRHVDDPRGAFWECHAIHHGPLPPQAALACFPESCEAFAAIVEQAADRMTPPEPLTAAQQSIWRAIAGRAMTGSQLADDPNVTTFSEELIRKRIYEMRQAGWKVEHRRGTGYFRPDRPPAT